MIHRPAFARVASSVGARSVLGFRRAPLAGPARLVLLALACSAPESGDVDDDLPDFNGTLNPGAGGASATPNPAGANGGSAQTPMNPGPGNNETPPGNLPVASNGGSGGTGNAGAPGTGGSSMLGTAGNGSIPNPGGAGGGGQGEPPGVLPGGFYLIDDFEGGRDPQWTENEVGGGAGTFTLDTALGANGSSSSMRIDANNQFQTMLQFAMPQAVRDANEVFGRVFLRLATTPGGAHFIWVEVGTAQNDGHEMRLGHNVGRLQSNHYSPSALRLGRQRVEQSVLSVVAVQDGEPRLCAICRELMRAAARPPTHAINSNRPRVEREAVELDHREPAARPPSQPELPAEHLRDEAAGVLGGDHLANALLHFRHCFPGPQPRPAARGRRPKRRR